MEKSDYYNYNMYSNLLPTHSSLYWENEDFEILSVIRKEGLLISSLYHAHLIFLLPAPHLPLKFKVDIFHGLGGGIFPLIKYQGREDP